MSAVAVLLDLAQRDIRVDLVGDRIRCRYAPGALAPELAGRVRARRREVIELLADPNALRLAAAQAIFGGVECEGTDTVAPAENVPPTIQCWACGLERSRTTLPCPRCHPPARLPSKRRLQ